MQSFLRQVATALYERFGSNMSQLVVVFPGKRAHLFLDQALAEVAGGAVWAPRYQTISELFQQASPYSLCDPIESVCRLYRAYSHHISDAQSLDQFYGWGEVLLADFDDIDKHMADAHRLFTNMADLRQLDDNSYISPEQEEALRSFFGYFSIDDNSKLKEAFLRLWNQMSAIYDDLLADMRHDGVLYEGALQRDVVMRLKEEAKTGAAKGAQSSVVKEGITYVFVGFNVLNAVEEALFDELQRRGRALFFWDYDLFYADPRRRAVDPYNEAGLFMERNLQRYGNELPAECFDNLRQPKDIKYVAASSENIQARYMGQWLPNHLSKNENETAVVLCNEQLLQPVLHCIRGPQAVNVTMGYPLVETPVYSLVNVLMALQTDGYDAARQRFRATQLRMVQRHPLVQRLDDELWRQPVTDGVGLLAYLNRILSALGATYADAVTTPEENDAVPNPLDILYAESIFVTYTTVNRLYDLSCGDAPLLSVSDQTLRRLLRRVLQSQTIPFHGEPAVGVQVMGMLETRALDFRNLLMLSVGEGFLPRAVADTSFIPYHLREAFGLTTIRHKVAVYAYYFYRLIQRAEHITFVYNESNAGTRQNEQSRFLRQLQAETDFPIQHLRLQAESTMTTAVPFEVAKTQDVMQRLYERYDRTGGRKAHLLSPSAMNCYTTCPMQFYYKHIEGLDVSPDPQDGLDAILFGNVFHLAARRLYEQLTSAGPVVRAADIEPMLEQGGLRLETFVRQAFREEFFKDRPEDYSGILIIAVRVMTTYLVQLLRHDLRLTPFRVLGVEIPRTRRMSLELPVGTLPNGQTHIELETGGIIDRLDAVRDDSVEGGTAIRVVDYKTGGLPGSVAQMERLFKGTGQKEHYYFQTILYALIVAQKENSPVTPCLFYVHKSGADDYSPKLKLEKRSLDDVREVADDFEQRLDELVHEIFNPQVPFTQTTKTDSCQFCDYCRLCGR